MAACTAAFATAGIAASATVRDASALSSSQAFGTSLVQLAPVGPAVSQSNRLVATRAALSEEQRTGGKKVLASFLATGAALSIAGAALAGNPVDFAKSKVEEAASTAQSAASNLPNLPNIQLPNAGAVQDAKNSADSFVNETKSRIDGIFGKNKPFPQNRVASTNGGTGNVLGDAKKRIANFGKNPIADNVTKATNDAKNSIAQSTGENSGSARAGRELLGQDSTRVDEATRKVKNLGNSFKSKAGDAVNEAKSFVGSAQNATPDISVPKLPEIPSIPNPLNNLNVNKGAEDLKGKAEDVKNSVASNLPNTPDLPSLPNPLEAINGSQDLKGKAENAKGNLASKAANAKGAVASKAAGLKRNFSKKVSEITQ
ncbi:hypothetical protein MPTK1_2g02030 [Marchantia polymorpha subsp. ruderalis]|uniref:Uncharacterized protein n=1 Tax=Marchantia polymorpha TaxID=3197 RepID=A0A2R6W875_MARPO|nr:hypothetical protein MARPO_0130s0011 [Marchantia polymorpha]BBN00777.1 hypothetical protein Mp_2g02030 [Marchantia polymorpha subsp. ruderalis]|eukprot:PTQ30054.1 hypothetical protein MARPO_0130s0011 [Marchantia polymorpha]